MKKCIDSNTYMRSDAVSAFRKLIFSLCDPPESEWEFYQSNLSLWEYEPGDLFQEPDELADSYAFIFRGLFKRYYRKENGDPIIFSFDGPGRAISDLPSLLNEKKSQMFIEAIRHSIILKTPPGFYKIIRRRHVSFEESARRITELRYLEFVDRSLDLLTLSAEQRYRKLLTSHAAIISEIEKKDIAAYLGIAPESLSRIRKQLAEK